MIFSDDGLVGWWAYLDGAWYGCYRGRGAFFSVYAIKVWLIHHVMNFVAHSSKEKNLSIEEITEGHTHGRSRDQGGDEERRQRSPKVVSLISRYSNHGFLSAVAENRSKLESWLDCNCAFIILRPSLNATPWLMVEWYFWGFHCGYYSLVLNV